MKSLTTPEAATPTIWIDRPWASLPDTHTNETAAVHTREWSSLDLAPEGSCNAFVVAIDTFNPLTTVATAGEPEIWVYVDQDASDLIEFKSVAGVRAFAATLLAVADSAEALLTGANALDAALAGTTTRA